uniref:Putative secreted protein n=1 Tax=Ixodes ricinus TaxID=34613 RepID=A0A6B0U4S9_IXORI
MNQWEAAWTPKSRCWFLAGWMSMMRAGCSSCGCPPSSGAAARNRRTTTFPAGSWGGRCHGPLLRGDFQAAWVPL